MEVTIIGCGGTGSAILWNLINLEKIHQINIIDYNKKQLSIVKKFLATSKIKHNHIKFFHVDLKSQGQIKKISKKSKIILNASFPIHNEFILKTCLANKAHYLDLASDPFKYPDTPESTTFDTLYKYNEKFLNNNLLAISNAGLSPGLTDLLVKHITNNKDIKEIDLIKISLAEKIDSKEIVASWSPHILMLEFLSPPTILNNGKIIEINSEKNSEIHQFPSPLGPIKIYPFSGHPELVTIPKFINKKINRIEIRGGMNIGNLNLEQITLEAIRKRTCVSQTIKNENIFSWISKSFVSPANFLEAQRKGIIISEIGGMEIEVYSKNELNNLKYSIVCIIDLETSQHLLPLANVSTYLVSVFPSVLIELLTEDKIKERGVICAGALSETKEILTRVEKKGLNLIQKIEVQNQ
ncbi:MAG: saccharopine dehydrogenase NADP-binding domain-containing protein [archaeon]|jgi:hypothetical protein